jgi:glycosyltransferase involved in cell wall biosynthesis
VAGPAGPLAKLLARVRPRLGKLIMKLQRGGVPYPRSAAVFGEPLADAINNSDCDVVNLHWINGEFLSVGQIGRMRKPIVWTMHDMWPFCGTEHYTDDGPEARWRHGYTRANRPPEMRGLDLDRWTWRRKQRAWRRPIHVVTPSAWLADCVRQSALFAGQPVTCIPNPLDLALFRPWPRDLARDAFKLPREAPLILFGALGHDPDGRKGLDLLLAAVRQLAASHCQAHVAIFGQSRPAQPPQVGLPVHWIGRLNDDISLALLYSAADVMVVPSRMDNLPQTGTEAQACGCPVVAFRSGGLPSVVADRETGYLAEPFDPVDLAAGINWVIDDSQRQQALARQARAWACRIWEQDRLLAQYLEVYQQTVYDAKMRVLRRILWKAQAGMGRQAGKGRG